MANNAFDPDYMMRATTDAALQRLIQNPATDPITDPPPLEAFKARRAPPAASSEPPQVGPGDAPAHLIAQRAAPATPKTPTMTRIKDEDLTEDVKEAMAVLAREDIVEQVDDHTWKFK